MILVLSLFIFRKRNVGQDQLEVLRVTVLANGLVTSAIITEYLRNNTEFMSFNLTDFKVTRYGKLHTFVWQRKTTNDHISDTYPLIFSMM